jgi:hypothetical protein
MDSKTVTVIKLILLKKDALHTKFLNSFMISALQSSVKVAVFVHQFKIVRTVAIFVFSTISITTGVPHLTFCLDSFQL